MREYISYVYEYIIWYITYMHDIYNDYECMNISNEYIFIHTQI